METLTEDDKLYINNNERKSFQWQVWPYCNNHCKFCFLGEANSQYIKKRQLTSLIDLNKAIDNLDFTKYNNISLIGGEFFQGQLNDEETYTFFFSTIRRIFQLYREKKIGSMWLTCTLTGKEQKHLYELLDLAENMGVMPKEKYSSSGLWLCTSWDADGRFHTPEFRKNWETNIKSIKKRYPWVKFNTTIILQKAFIEMYLNGRFRPKEFMEEYHTSIFYMQPCLAGITEMMLQNEAGELRMGDDFSSYWLKLKQDANKAFDFFPKRKDFVRFLAKYYAEDRDSFVKLFNINYRSDEIHLNINSEAHDRVIARVKNGSAPEESFPPPLKCGHVYNYAPYIDSNHCCICDRDMVAGV